MRALVRLEDRPDLALYEVGRAERAMPEESLGLPRDGARLARKRSRASRRLLRLLPLPRLRCADLALGGVDLFHHASPDPPPVARALETAAAAEVPARGAAGARVLARMDGVLAFSADGARRLVEDLGLAPERVHRVHVGCEHWRRELAALPERESPPVVLVLGAMRRERRHHAIAQAFGLLRARGLEARLVVALGAGSVSDAARTAGTVEFLRPTEAAMPALVARASVLVHLAEDEATPVTPLEAFSVGTPVVASRLPAFEEALGGLALLVENAAVDADPGVLADLLASAIAGAGDAGARAERMRLASEFTWDRCARETLAAWRAIVTPEYGTAAVLPETSSTSLLTP